MDVFVARQPILNRNKVLYAYELLFRDALANFVPNIDGDVATSSLLSSSFFTIGIESITGGRKAFINFTENLIINELPLLFTPEQTVVEVLEDVRPLDNVISALKKFSGKGYTLALDDFVFDENLQQMIQLADVIKIDFRQTSIKEIENLLSLPVLKQKKLLAEKVETYDEFNQAARMGFEYFQGYFFCKPEIIKGRSFSGSQLSLLRILAEVNKSDFVFDEIEKIISTDLAVSYKLLRYINSPYFRGRNEIRSIREALIYLGEEKIRRFISLVALSIISTEKPSELIRNACIRARFCEKLGSAGTTAIEPGTLFTLGMFSNIDAIMDQSMAEIMESLPLSEDIIAALVDSRGFLFDFLALVISYEKGEWSEIPALADKICIAEELIPSFYEEACAWSNALPV